MFNNCVTIFITITFIPFVIEEWISKHPVEEICTLNIVFAGVVGGYCFRKPRGQAGWKACMPES